MLHRIPEAMVRGAVLLVLVASCSTRVSRDNPYDPEASAPLPGRVQGQLSAPTLASPQGIVVRLEDGPAEVSPVAADEDGAFLFDHVPHGAYTLEVRHQGFWDLVLRNLTVRVNETLDLGVLTLIPLTETDEASVIQGTAQLEGTTQHGGVQVRVVGRPFDTLTNPQGVFLLQVPEGTHDLELSYPNYETILIEDVHVGRASMVLLSEPVVLRSDPATIAGVALRRTCAPNPADEVDLAADGAVVSLLGTGHTGTVAGDGTFAITGVPAGVYTLRLSLADHEPIEVAGLWVLGGQLLQLPEPLLARASKGGVAGTVFYGGASSHEGILVQLSGTDFMTFSAADGGFRINGVCAGPGYELKAVPLQDGFNAVTRGGVSVLANQVTTVPEITLARQQGGLTLAGGSSYTNAADRVVSYELKSVPDGTTSMRMSEDPADFDDPDAGWVAFVPEGLFTLSAGEGTKRVYAQVGDGATVSSLLQDSVVLDLAAPAAPSIAIEGGDGFSNDPDGAVLVTLTATEVPAAGVDAVSGLAAVKIVNHDLQSGAPPPDDADDPAWDAAVPRTYNRTIDHPLLRPSVDEEKEIWVRFGDAAGNWSAPVSARVVLDRDDPDGVTFAISGSAPGYTGTPMVTLVLTASDENPGIQMRLANDSAFLGSPWQPFVPIVPWTLPGGDGAKQVWMQLADAAGNKTQSFSATIELDTQPPVGVRLTVDQAPYSATRDLTLTLAAGGAAEMIFALQPDFTDAGGGAIAWQSFSTAGQLLLPNQDGAYTVYAKYRDAAHNESVTSSATVVLDRVAPQIAAASIVEGTHVQAPNVTVLITAVAGPLDAHFVEIDVEDVSSGAITAGGFTPFSPMKGVSLSGAPGDKRLHLRLRDAAGNTTPAPLTLDVTYDPNPPVLGGVTLRGPGGGTTWTTSANVTVEIDATGADQMLLSNRADFAGSSWLPFADENAWTLPPHEGPHTVHVLLRDLAGNTTQSQAGITLDRSPPAALSIHIDGGAAYSRTGVVELVLAASDNLSGAASVQLSADAGFANPTTLAWPAGAPSLTHGGWTLTAGDGLRSVFARFVDGAGNASEAAASILVDTSSPQGTVSIAGGAPYTAGTSVALMLTATSDVQHVALANASTIDCASPPNAYESFSTVRPWVLDAAPGLKTVSVCLRDAAGNTSTASDTIILDTVNPGVALLINGGAARTTSTAVSLSLSADADVASMALANGASLDCAGAVYEPYTTQRGWTLASGNGTQYVSVCVRDHAGRTGSATAQIELDQLKPNGTISLAAGAVYTASRTVQVELAFPDDTAGYALAEAALDCGTATYTNVTLGDTGEVTSFMLSSGDGGKSVVACFIDVASNTASAADTIVLDTSPPEGSVVIAGGAGYATSTSVTLGLTAPADATHMSVAEAASLDCASAPYESFATTKAMTLGGEGTRTVAVCFKDAAGLTARASDTIVVDTVPPSGAVSVNGGVAYAQSSTVTLSLSVSADVVSMAVANGASLDCGAAIYEPFSASRQWVLGAGQGSQSVQVCIEDAAGNRTLLGDSITVDTIAPSGATLQIDGGAAYTTSSSVTLSLGTPEPVSIALGNEGLDCSSAAYGDYAASIAWTLEPADGLRRVVACFRDGAGWVVSKSASIVLDTTPPVGSVSIAGGAAYTQSDLVSLAFTAPADVTHAAIVNGAGLDCATATYSSFSASYGGWDLDPGDDVANDGLKWVTVCFKDAAGLTASASSGITLDRVNPSGSMTLAGGRTAVSSREIGVELSGVSPDVVEMAVAETSLDCGSATYGAFSSHFSFTVSDGNGGKAIIACLRDAAGRTAQLSGSVELDRSPPSGSLSINAGAAWTTSTVVTVAGSSADAVEYALANEAIDCTAAVYTSFTTSFTAAGWILLNQNGVRTVKACLRDAAGNVAVVDDGIGLDTTAPGAASLQINGGAAVTADAVVTLSINAADDLGVAEMYLSRNGLFNDGAWETYAANKTWDLNGAAANVSETRAVYLRVRDAAQNVSATGSASIVVDYDAPTLSALSIDAAAATTRSTGVMLTLTASDVAPGVVAQMRLSESSSFDGASWEAFTSPRACVLSSTNGTKTVYAQVRDAAGRASVTRSDTIVLDTQAPVIDELRVTAPSNGHTKTTAVTLSLTASDNLSTGAALSAAFANAATLACDTATYDTVFPACDTPPCSVSKSWTLPDVEGTLYVSACVRDQTGNVTTVSSKVALVYDKSPPPQVPGLTLVAGSRQLEASWGSVTDAGASGVSHYQLEYGTRSNFASSQTVEVAATSAVIDELYNRREHFVRVRAVDLAGNVGAYSEIASAVPGFKLATINTPTLGRTAWRPVMTYGQGTLYVVALRPDGTTNTYVDVYSCPVASADCRVSTSWQRVSLRPLRAVTSSRPAVVQTGNRLYIGVIEKESGVNTYAAVTWVCELSSGCASTASFTRVQHEGFSGLMNQSFVAMSANTSRVQLGYYWEVGPNDKRPRVKTCNHNNDCASAASWNVGTLPTSAHNPVVGSDLSLAATDDAVFAGYHAAGGSIVVSRCAQYADCDADGDWGSAGYVIPTTDDGGSYWSAQLAATPARLYVLYHLSDWSSSQQRIARCNLSSSCDASSDWTTPGVLLNANDHGLGFRHMVELTYGNGALHAAWWREDLGALVYGACDAPDTADCTQLASWHLMVVDPFVTRDTRPSVGVFESNVGLVWLDDADRLKLALPGVPSPMRHATAPGAGQIRGAWSALPFVGGYEQVYDGDGAPWANQIGVGDPLRDRNTISIAADADFLASVRAYNADGELSDDSDVFQVRPFQTGEVADRQADSLDCWSSLTAETWQCARYVTTARGSKLSAAYSMGGNVYFAQCDSSLSSCAAPGNWASYMVLDHTQSLYVQGIVTSASRIYVGMRNSINDSLVAWCSTSSGCDEVADWTWYRVTTGDSYDTQVDFGRSRVWVVSRTFAHDLRVSHCLESTDCTDVANWTTVSVVTGDTSSRGLSIASGASYTGVVKASDTGIRFYRCSGTCTSFSGTTVVSLAAPPLERSVRLTMASGDEPSIIGVWDGQARVTTCPMLAFYCSGSSGRWGTASLGPVVLDKGALTDITSYGARYYAVYSSLDDLRLATCASGCGHPDAWQVASIYRSTSLVEPIDGRVLTHDGNISIGFGFDDGASDHDVRVLWKGRFTPQ